MKTMKVALGGSIFALGLLLACGAEAPTKQPSLESAKGKRETVLDRRVHIEPGVAEVPQLPPLCDTLKMKKRRVNVGDCRLYCEVEGSGPALVLINGGPGGTHHGFHPHFARAAGFCQVVYYDQRGCGQSDYQKGKGYTISQAVADLDQLRSALKLDRWVVLGWSYGGVLAQCYTVKHPERVAGLVLVGSGTDPLRLELQPSRQGQYLSSAERRKITELYHNEALSMDKGTYNGHLNGDWKRQSFYKPSPEELARMALYEWKHDPVFRESIGQDLQRIDLRGLFEGCPIPVLLLEGKQDLTWGTDKPEKLHACFPGSRMVLFDRSAHGPFSDEPEQFFSTLREFMKDLPKSPTSVPKWKERVAARLAEKEKSPEHILQTAGYGPASSKGIAAGYSETWLPQLSDPGSLCRLGFALYDARRYADALIVFRELEKHENIKGVALVWEGQMLDLLGRRQEALVAYGLVAGHDLYVRHDQYGIQLTKEYIQQRLETPFAVVENHYAD